jgi:hypothetical protein
MRRLSGLVLAGAIMMLPALSQSHGTAFAQQDPETTTQQDQETTTEQEPETTTQQEPEVVKTTFAGDVVLWAFTVNPDKTADYEGVLAKVKEALQKSDKPEAKQQLAGWKVMKSSTPQPTGEIVYVHVIDPVVRDADYSITNIVFDVFKDPAEQTAFFETYRGAVKAGLFLIQGPVSVDLSR